MLSWFTTLYIRLSVDLAFPGHWLSSELKPGSPSHYHGGMQVSHGSVSADCWRVFGGQRWLHECPHTSCSSRREMFCCRSWWLFATQHWVFSVQPSFGIFPLCNYFKGLRQRVSYHLNGKLSVLKKHFSTSLEHKAPLIRAHSQTDGRAGLLDFSFLLLCHNHTMHASISEKEMRENKRREGKKTCNQVL